MTGHEEELERLTGELQHLGEQEAEHARELQANAPLTREGVEAAQAEMEKIRGRMLAKRRQIERVQEQVREDIERRQDELRQLVHRSNKAIETALEPIRKVVAGLEEGLTSMGLYLGRGEQIVTIREGAPADALEPIVIRQMVLAMDEETGIFAEGDGINAEDVEEFDAWLLEEAHVAQIVPEERCVVACVPRWRWRSDGDLTWRDDDDTLTHFIIRNGECLYRTSVQFHAGERLIPAPDEFVAFFKRTRFSWETRKDEEEAIKPNTAEYARAMEQSDARSRHYLRIGLILQGLVDRTDIFEPLHPAGINMLSDPSKHSEKVRIITDGEGGLESGELSFLEWQRETNAQLRRGMRIVGAFDTDEFRSANGREGRYDQRLRPNGAEYPPTGEPLQIEDTEGGGALVVRYARTRETYDPSMWVESKTRPGWGHTGGYRVPKRRASCVVYPSDSFILAYDLADAELMERFLGNRRDRREYKDLWPLMRAVWKAKREEDEEEAPFRQMLSGVLARENNVSVGEAEAAIPDLVRWFKLANHYHRPLLVDEGAHAVKLIVAEHRRRVNDARRTVDDELVSALASEYPDYLVIARPRRGGYLVLRPEEPDRDIYVRELLIAATGEVREDRRWQLVGSRAERWRVVRATERWEDWDRMAHPQKHLTGPERDALVQQLIGDDVLAVTQLGLDGEFETWIAEPVVFDPAHPLTAKAELPRYDLAYEWRWQRKGMRATPTLRRRDSHHWSNGAHPPWSTEKYAKGRTVRWEAESAAEWVLERERLVADAQRYRGGLSELLATIEDNLVAETDMPRSRTRSWRTGEEKLLDVMLSIGIERGLVAQGMPVEELYAAAVAHGMTAASLDDWHDEGDPVPPLPEELEGRCIDLTSREEPGDDEDEGEDEGELEDEQEDEEITALGDRLRQSVADALAPDAKPDDPEPVAKIGDAEILPPQ